MGIVFVGACCLTRNSAVCGEGALSLAPPGERARPLLARTSLSCQISAGSCTLTTTMRWSGCFQGRAMSLCPNSGALACLLAKVSGVKWWTRLLLFPLSLQPDQLPMGSTDVVLWLRQSVCYDGFICSLLSESLVI